MGRIRKLLPQQGFFFSRPLVILQSDDWGRVGLRDREGFVELRAAGICLGERPYDLYTLETAEDVQALASVFGRHRDSVGRPPVVGMNFLTANLDFAHAVSSDASTLDFVPLAQGLPSGWSRPGLLEAYREGIRAGVFYPGLHGISHFCTSAVQRSAQEYVERDALMRTLWKAGTPYIHWRMPWIGYEYWDPESTNRDRFLDAQAQSQSIGRAVGLFAQIFKTMPRSACAPGYRANSDTHRAWSQYGIRCAQNGPVPGMPPHFDRHSLMHLYRNVEFEPATNEGMTIDGCLQRAERCFAQGIPAIVSVHSINFHSTVRDFRVRTLSMLDELFSALEARHSDLLYVHDEDLYRLVESGTTERQVKIDVRKRPFWKVR
jgi:hypothetical protein